MPIGTDDVGSDPSLRADEPATWRKRDPTRGSARAAAAVFGIYVALAIPVLVSFGSSMWFARNDDWDLLLRNPTDLAQLFQPVNQHWSTLPTLSYFVTYRAFGLNYTAFQVPVIACYLGLAVLIRVVMRRAGVGPWLATAAASIFVLFGPGDINALFAIQISMMITMVCGFGQVILADHDGPIDRRDWLGLALGALGLLSSGVGPLMVLAVGISTVLRRSWRIAVFHTVPLAIMYLVWYWAERSLMTNGYESGIPVMAKWTVSGETGMFLAIDSFALVATLLGAMLLAGTVAAARERGWTGLRSTAAPPIALAVVAPLIFAAAARQRGVLGLDGARSPHYVGLATAMTLPLLALAADALIRRWRRLAPVVFFVLLAGIVPDITAFHSERIESRADYALHEKQLVLGAAHSPDAAHVSVRVRLDPSPAGTDDMTMGFLRTGVRTGRVPEVSDLDPSVEREVKLRLSLLQSGDGPGGRACTTITSPRELRLDPGDQLVLSRPVQIQATIEGGPTVPVEYGPIYGKVLTEQLAGIDMGIVTVPPGGTFAMCR